MLKAAHKKLYFETLCVLLIPEKEISPPSLQKLLRFCKDSSLRPYIIEALDDSKRVHLLLTKQNLTSKTGYFCSISHLNIRKFGSVEVLMGNNVKRLLSKSDSKFLDRFAQLLERNHTYTRIINSKKSVIFSRNEHDGVDAYQIFTPSQLKSRDPQVCYVRNQIRGEKEEYLPTNISPPNLILNIWEHDKVACRYMIQALSDGIMDDRECKNGIWRPRSPGLKIEGLGWIELPDEDNEPLFNGGLYKRGLARSIPEIEASFVETCEEEPFLLKQTLAILESKEKKAIVPEMRNYPDPICSYLSAKLKRQSRPFYKLF